MESGCDVARERMARAQAFLAKAQEQHAEFRQCFIKDTPADGICFLHGIRLQLELEEHFSVWDIAVSFLQWMSVRKFECVHGVLLKPV